MRRWNDERKKTPVLPEEDEAAGIEVDVAWTSP